MIFAALVPLHAGRLTVSLICAVAYNVRCWRTLAVLSMLQLIFLQMQQIQSILHCIVFSLRFFQIFFNGQSMLSHIYRYIQPCDTDGGV